MWLSFNVAKFATDRSGSIECRYYTGKSSSLSSTISFEFAHEWVKRLPTTELFTRREAAAAGDEG